MSREWKPGDVAMTWSKICDEPEVGIYVLGGSTDSPRGARTDAWWRSGGYLEVATASARPLVVVDPEDREQVARLADAFCLARWSHIESSSECDPLTRDSMTQALREFANPTPPKPDEPMGLGAVVEDAEGERYVRCPTRDGVAWRGTGHWVYRDWCSIDQPRVLSEGVVES